MGNCASNYFIKGRNTQEHSTQTEYTSMYSTRRPIDQLPIPPSTSRCRSFREHTYSNVFPGHSYSNHQPGHTYANYFPGYRNGISTNPIYSNTCEGHICSDNNNGPCHKLYTGKPKPPCMSVMQVPAIKAPEPPMKAPNVRMSRVSEIENSTPNVLPLPTRKRSNPISNMLKLKSSKSAKGIHNKGKFTKTSSRQGSSVPKNCSSSPKPYVIEAEYSPVKQRGNFIINQSFVDDEDEDSEYLLFIDFDKQRSHI